MTERVAELTRLACERRLQIAVDGPAGAGKSTVARKLAEMLGCRYLDTGLMYRALALLALRRNIAPSDASSLRALLHQTAFELAGQGQGVLMVNGAPAPAELHSDEVDASVSEVAAHPAIREIMVQCQRDLAGDACIVMVGRDIGTTVLPGSPVKLWVTASAEERARRRLIDRASSGGLASPELMLESITSRDALDAGRAASPLKRAADAIVLETDRLTPDESAKSALRAVRSVLE